MNKVKISTFKSFNSMPVNIHLGCWVQSTMNPKSKFVNQVKQYRQTGHDNFKKSLPLATVGAVCEGGRKISNVTARTGWIALDIDAEDNPHLEDAAEVRDAIADIVYVAFAGLSVSGKGIWALVKIKDPWKQKKYFEQLQIDFKSRGVILDSTKGKNPNDARFYSFDPNAYVANDYKVYDRLPTEKVISKQVSPAFHPPFNDTRVKVEQLISKINTDITGGYQNWLQLGFALESEFGESGRNYFQAISQYHPHYNRHECNQQYTHCLKHNGCGISIGTFFHKCKEKGITV